MRKRIARWLCRLAAWVVGGKFYGELKEQPYDMDQLVYGYGWFFESESP